MTETQPKHKIRVGAVSVAIWENTHKNKEGKDFVVQTATIDKNFKDKNGEWQTTNGFNLNELARLKLAVDKAYEFMALTTKEGEQ